MNFAHFRQLSGVKFIYCVAILSATTAHAKTAEQLLASGDPQSQGEAIALEFEARDIGWQDVDMDTEMVLRSATGEESSRSQRIRILQNPNRDEGDKSFITFDSPRDIKGTALLSYAKIHEADDQWLFLPALERVKRIASNNKSGAFVGSEFSYEDITGNEVSKFSWTFLGLESCAGNLQCFKLEMHPKYDHSGYSKRITWIDTQHFLQRKTEFYDLKGELLKTQTSSGYQPYLDKFWRADKVEMENHQSGRSTILHFKSYRFKNGFTDSDFSQAVLKRVK